MASNCSTAIAAWAARKGQHGSRRLHRWSYVVPSHVGCSPSTSLPLFPQYASALSSTSSLLLRRQDALSKTDQMYGQSCTATASGRGLDGSPTGCTLIASGRTGSTRWDRRSSRRPPPHTTDGPGAGTALYPGKPPQGLTVRFDAIRGIRLPEPREDWVEVEPGVTWRPQARLGTGGSSGVSLEAYLRRCRCFLATEATRE